MASLNFVGHGLLSVPISSERFDSEKEKAVSPRFPRHYYTRKKLYVNDKLR